jgi:hypothetical protein
MRLWTAALSVALATSAQAAEPAKAPARINCFWTSQWGGWKSPSPDVIYLHVNISDYYKVELSVPSSLLQDRTFHLRSINASTISICTPSDLRLVIDNFHGVSQPLYPSSLVKLTDAEVVAIPPQFKPY